MMVRNHGCRKGGLIGEGEEVCFAENANSVPGGDHCFCLAVLAALLVTRQFREILIPHHEHRCLLRNARFNSRTKRMGAICCVPPGQDKGAGKNDGFAQQGTIAISCPANGGARIKVDWPSRAKWPVVEMDAAVLDGMYKDRRCGPGILQCIMKRERDV